MNTKFRVLFVLGLMLGLFSVSFLTPATKVVAQTTPDVLGSYMVTITPQTDGSLIMAYALQNYCAKSDWPSDLPYLQVGVPNSNFTISDWGPREGNIKLANAEPVSGKFVQLDFDQSYLPRNGDCFDFNFSIVQANMARTDPASGNITFEFFAAGWDFPIEVRQLTIKWALPADPALLKLTDPAPMSQEVGYMVWTWDNPQPDNSDMFRGSIVQLAYDKSAFTLPAEPVTQSGGNGGESGNSFGGFLTFVIVIVVIAVVILIVVFAINVFSGGISDTSSDSSPDEVYTPPIYRPSPVTYESEKPRRRDTSTPTRVPRPVSTPSQPRRKPDPPSRPYSPPSTSGGGFGGSSGHSSGCAHSSCACACACAGGGRVGCSRKGIGIKCLSSVIVNRHLA